MINIPRLQVITVWKESWVDAYRWALLWNGIRDEDIDIHLSPYSARRSPQLIINDILDHNEDNRVSGIIGLTPTPDTHYKAKVFDQIDPRKDVDCQTRHNFHAFLDGDETVPFAPATAEAVLKIIEQQGIENMNIAILGKGAAVWLPLAELCNRKKIPYTIIQSWAKKNPNWENDLRDSKANVVVWAWRDGHTVNQNNIPSKLKYGVDVTYADVTMDNWDIQTVGSFSPCMKDIIPGYAWNSDVGRVTTKTLIEHVKKAHQLMNV